MSKTNKYTNHTGGAYGVDTVGDIIGREYKVNKKLGTLLI